MSFSSQGRFSGNTASERCPRGLEMEQEHNQLTEEVINELELPEGCTCYKPGFGVQCKAKDIGVESFAKCLEKDPYACKFSVPFGYSYYCTCSVRVYLAKELKK
jgi:hypothetical protein